MRNRVLVAWSIMACVCALLVSAAGAEERTGTCAGGPPSVSVSQDGTIVSADGEAYIPAPRPLPYDVEIESIVAHAEGGDGGAVSESAVSVLVYNNDLSNQVTGPAGSAATAKLADDVAITVRADCLLDKYVVRVTGDRDNTGSAPNFTVNTWLYKTCPGTGGGVTPISGSACSFPNLSGTDVKELTCTALTNVKLPDNLYVAVSFSRDNCGVVVGAPPQLGFSADQFDFPGFPCQAYLGGYPEYRHASFWLQIYAKEECAKSFVVYKNTNHAGNAYSPGGGVYFADDIRMSMNTCNMIAYEVAVKGFGFFNFDLRTYLANENPASGGVIPGTERTYFSVENRPQVARFAVDPPISLPPNFYITFKGSSDNAGPIFTNRQAALGTTEDLLCVYRDNEWRCAPLSPTTYAAFDVAIICDGEPPVGACCDMVQLDAQGESVCRALPEMNCGADPEWNLWVQDVCEDKCLGGTNHNNPCTRQADCPGYTCVGGTRSGLVCDPNKPQSTECPGGFCRKGKCPGPFAFPCGQSACCTHDDFCLNYTSNECYARPPLDKPRLYLRGSFCAYQGFACPYGACLGREGECSLPHPGQPGCENPFCCTAVCRVDSFCCLVEWDEQCAANTFRYCSAAPANDECWDPDLTRGARLVEIPSSTESDNLHATENTDDPGFCCHKDSPGATGFGTVWYKFVANSPTVSVKTCFSNSPANDSLVSVYAPAEPDRGICTNGAPCSIAAQDCPDDSDCVLDAQYACGHLNLIGCSDDVQFCSAGNKNSSLCLTGLTVGQTYYVLVGSKPDISPGDYPQLAYRLDVVSPCTNLRPPMPNDFCQGAEQVVEKCVGGAENGTPCDPSVDNDCPGGVCRVAKPFDLSGGASNSPATFDCPGEACVDPLMQNDVWYTWNAPCDGVTEVTTCAPGVDPEDQVPTTMVVYNVCQCPVQIGTIAGCSIGALGECGLASKVTFGAVEGQCYQIRIGGQGGSTPAGELKVTVQCVGCVIDADCNDDNVCTNDACVAGSCENTANVAACDDGLFCNGADTCIAGACSIHAGNPCAPGVCDETNDRCPCPAGAVTFVNPQSGTVDARQPYPSNDAAQRQGIKTFRVTGPNGFATLNCWTLCETKIDGTQNSITSIVNNGDGSFNVNLARTISIGAVTTLTYTESGGTRHRGEFTSHPANVNADSASNAADILRIIDILNNVLVPPWGNYSCDADQSNLCNPADILRVIDLLNGTDQFDTWLGIGLPACGACCP